jgi:hypothetical protein
LQSGARPRQTRGDTHEVAMSPRRHLKLLLQGIGVWVGFWVAGLPDYYQQYSTVLLAIGSILLSVAISLGALWILRRGRPQFRRARACWIAFYFTVPFAVLDTLYCGWYLGHGAGYLASYWYLTVFYLTPWLTFPPTAWLLREPRPT